MIAHLLPPQVVVVEVRGDDPHAQFLEQEQPLVRHAVEKRRREFATGRDCARRALAELGVEPTAVLSGEKGEPLWPDGVVGSITHCDGYRGCAVAYADDVASIGIDAEPNRPLPQGLMPDIASRDEIAATRRLASADARVHWDRLLFSAKESIYKAWFPLTRRWLGFEDATVTIDPTRSVFACELSVPTPSLAGATDVSFLGRWDARADLLVTSVVAAPADRR